MPLRLRHSSLTNNPRVRLPLLGCRLLVKRHVRSPNFLVVGVHVRVHHFFRKAARRCLLAPVNRLGRDGESFQLLGWFWAGRRTRGGPLPCLFVGESCEVGGASILCVCHWGGTEDGAVDQGVVGCDSSVSGVAKRLFMFTD